MILTHLVLFGFFTGAGTAAASETSFAYGVNGDLNTRLRDYFAQAYGSGENEDLSTLFARFEDHNREP